ncbi:MAG: transcription elongation factor GreA [Lachnospiraceae bacterium]|jgi:transcription elongation factor GreA|nr:transcription elongation factor GreA [Lachnospiraceae bacterium]
MDELTKKDLEKINKEIEYRKVVVRAQALEAVKTARAHGDLSENFEYQAAKRDKNRNDSRIRYLEKLVRNARVISDESKTDEIGINNTVTLYVEDDRVEETYRLVTSIRGDSLKGLISIDSPLGKAIMRRKVGDRVFVPLGDKDGYYVVVRKLENTTDDDSLEIRSY